jgi:hypothetical protein
VRAVVWGGDVGVEALAKEAEPMSGILTRSSNGSSQRAIVWIVGIAISYDIGVLGLQLFDWFGPLQASTAIGEYSGAIAVALCVIAAILIWKMTQSRRLRILSLATAAIFAVLTVDDIFSIHERMNNDDYLAIFLWLIAGGVLFMILRLEKPGRTATITIWAGILLNGLAALADGADGGIFTLDMISPFELGLSKEMLELAYMGLYLVGFSRLLLGHQSSEVTVRAIPSAKPIVGLSDRRSGGAAEDGELLELEAWYWAWRSHFEAAETDDQGDRSIDELLSFVGKLTVAPAQSMIGVATKLRVLKDMMDSGKHFELPEMEVEARLLEALVGDANRLTETTM